MAMDETSNIIRNAGELFDALSDHITAADILAANMISNISVAIVEKRLIDGVSRKDFAKRIGVSVQTLRKFERGDHNFSVEQIAKIIIGGVSLGRLHTLWRE